MGRIRTAAHLQSALDAELGWRVLELGIMKAAIFAASGPRQVTLMRAAVPLVYSHWEGFVKRTSSYYGDYLNERGLTYGDLKNNFLGVEALGIVAGLHDIKRMISTASKLANSFLDIESKPVNIDLWSKIKDIGNLNYDLLIEIVDFLGLSSSLYTTKKVFIDETLVGTRNKIAHGERINVDIPSIEATIKQTIDMLNVFKSDIENSVTSKLFLR